MKKIILLLISCFTVIYITSCKKDENDTDKQVAKTDSIGSLTDIDGNVYRTIKIGKQWWMAHNLTVTHYQNGDLVPKVTDGEEWAKLTSGARCNYEDNVNKAMLYNWYTASDSRNIAPEGWHVPTKADWDTLIKYAGGSDLAGAYLANKSFELTGSRNGNGGYEFPNYGDWWASNEFSSGLGYHCGHPDGDPAIYLIGFDKRYGFAIKCIKDN